MGRVKYAPSAFMWGVKAAFTSANLASSIRWSAKVGRIVRCSKSASSLQLTGISKDRSATCSQTPVLNAASTAACVAALTTRSSMEEANDVVQGAAIDRLGHAEVDVRAEHAGELGQCLRQQRHRHVVQGLEHQCRV